LLVGDDEFKLRSVRDVLTTNLPREAYR
jgi:hypothetical protein